MASISNSPSVITIVDSTVGTLSLCMFLPNKVCELFSQKKSFLPLHVLHLTATVLESLVKVKPMTGKLFFSVRIQPEFSAVSTLIPRANNQSADFPFLFVLGNSIFLIGFGSVLTTFILVAPCVLDIAPFIPQ